MAHEWRLKQIRNKLKEIEKKGLIPIPKDTHRNDDGIVGQILEREFGVVENNISLGDLGKFELKGIRRKSSNITLSHKTPDSGMTPIQIFHKFGYLRDSKSKPGVKKKNFFVVINGKKENPRGFILKSTGLNTIQLIHRDKVTGNINTICSWNLKNSLTKMNKIILVTADTKGKTKAKDEEFHYKEALLLHKLKPLKELIEAGIIVIEFSIDQEISADGSGVKSPHDRGPHIRVAKRYLKKTYKRIIKII